MYAPAAHGLNLLCLLLQIVGSLGNPFVTIIYLLEQLSVFIFGSTSRATDLRIVLSFGLDLVLAFVFGWFAPGNKAVWVIPYFASRNLLFGLGLKRPFNIVNEELEK